MNRVPMLLIVTLLAVPSWGQKDADKPSNKEKKAKRVDREKRNFRDEDSLLEFVEENHTELVPMLSWLKKERPEEYRKAVASIGRSATRISQMKRKNPDRYETELESWQLQSRIQLLAAKLAVNDSDDTRAELRKLIDKSMDLKVDRLVDDVAAMEKRIERMNEEIERISSERSTVVDEAFQKLVKATKRVRDRKKKKSAKDLETGKRPDGEKKKKKKDGEKKNKKKKADPVGG